METIDGILQAAHAGESSDWEFKSAAGGFPGSLWETYSAMANTEGGTIVLGANERDGRVKLDGLSKAQAERYRQDLWNTVRNRGKVSVDLLQERDVEVVGLDSGYLLSLRVPRAGRSQRPVFLNAQPLGNTYRRRHEGDFRCTEEEVRRMFADADLTPPDHRVLRGFSIQDLDPVSLAQYRQRLRAAKGEHPWLGLDDQALLEKLGGWRQDRETGLTGLTLAGLLMFGKSLAIGDPLAAPRFQVDYREKLDPTVRWTDREHPDGTWEGNLFQFYQRVWPKLIRGLPVPFQLVGGQRRDETPVHEALREAFVNALVHADHSAPGGVVVERYPDRFVFENPGILLVSREQFWRGGFSECRNKALQQMFFMMGGGDRAGSGVDKIRAAWKTQHWRAPILEERAEPDRLRLTMPMISLIPEETLDYLRNGFGEKVVRELSQDEVQALATAHLEGGVSNARLQELLDAHSFDISRMLVGLCERGFLLSDARRRWTRYRIAEPSQSGEAECSDAKETNLALKSARLSLSDTSLAPNPPDSSPKNDEEGFRLSLEEIAAPVAQTSRAKPEVVRNTILLLCSDQFLPITDLASLLHRNGRVLRTNYLSPMLNEGLLRRRFPDDPNHPQQAYKTAQPTPTDS